MKKVRQSNFELLRVIAMLMIVCLHYLSKGGALEEPTGAFSFNGYLAWLIEAFCLMAVNVYVLLSGYFASSTAWTLKRPVKLWLQVWFYSMLFGVIAILSTTFFGGGQFDIYELFQYLFPIVTEHYWFATAFLLLTLLAPFLHSGAMQLEKRTFQGLLGMLLLFCSVAKTVIPMQLPWDYAGYDVVWLICPYLTGMYIQRFGLGSFFAKKKNCMLCYVANAGIIYASMIMIRMVYLRTGALQDFIHYSYSYNDLFCYIGAVALFSWFAGIEIKKEKTGVMINRLAKTTFGVYLIHEHAVIRYQWPVWFQCGKFADAATPLFLLHLIGTILCVYVMCSVIEYIRQYLFLVIAKKISKGRGYARG